MPRHSRQTTCPISWLFSICPLLVILKLICFAQYNHYEVSRTQCTLERKRAVMSPRCITWQVILPFGQNWGQAELILKTFWVWIMHQKNPLIFWLPTKRRVLDGVLFNVCLSSFFSVFQGMCKPPFITFKLSLLCVHRSESVKPSP